jgi:hypothetical protein
MLQLQLKMFRKEISNYMRECQRFFANVKYTCPYDDIVYNKMISICDYDLNEIIQKELRYHDKTAKVEDFELFVMNRVATVGDVCD